MKVDIISIGNSRGIRIPKALLQHYGFEGQVELSPVPEGILVASVTRPRADWVGRFAVKGEVLFPDIGLNPWEDEEWVW